LIVGSKIKRISAVSITAPERAEVIDGGGKILMPGLTDAHWHMTMAANLPANLAHRRKYARY
jgi:imidazolonepropionase-like amidohydrolase